VSDPKQQAKPPQQYQVAVPGYVDTLRHGVPVPTDPTVPQEGHPNHCTLCYARSVGVLITKRKNEEIWDLCLIGPPRSTPETFTSWEDAWAWLTQQTPLVSKAEV
jgi:hypothetical protein